jgi:hypothetical protein
LSTIDLLVDSSVILALREEGVQRGLFISRISDDISLMRVVEKLIAGRRLLLAGAAESTFSGNEMNVKIIKGKVSLISDEISMIKQELELKKAARGDTIITLLTRFQARRNVKSRAINNGAEVEQLRAITGG